MSPGSRPAPVAALDHPAMEMMMRELASNRLTEPQSPTSPAAYISVVSVTRNHDECHRKWFISRFVAQTHLGISQLPDPLDEVRPPSDRSVVTPEQRVAERQVQEWFMEGFEDVMMRFYNLGVRRVSVAAHLYALDLSLWMRGYAIPCNDFDRVKFNFAKPLCYVGPFSSDYDNFSATKSQESLFFTRPITPNGMPSQTSLVIAHQVANTAPTITPTAREEANRANPKTPATDGAPAPTAQENPGGQNPKPDAAISSAVLDQPPGGFTEETKPVPLGTSAAEARSTFTAKASNDSNLSNRTGGGIDQPQRHWEDRRALPATSATKTRTTSTDESSRDDRPIPPSAGSSQPPRIKTEPSSPEAHATHARSSLDAPSNGRTKKRFLDEANSTALEPQPKRSQTGAGLPIRTLTSLGFIGQNEAQLRFPWREQSRIQLHDSYRPQPLARDPRRRQVSSLDVCGNLECRSRYHELADCFGPPSTHGDMKGCPLCNTEQHNFDSCLNLGSISKAKLFDLLVTRRANLPPIRTTISIPILAASANRLDMLARTMPLLKTTVKDIYFEMKPWYHGDRTRLLRDPYLPSDLVPFLEVLTKDWHHITTQTMQTFIRPEEVPHNMQVFKSWTRDLVPYRKVFEDAKIHVIGLGNYPFGSKGKDAGWREVARLRLLGEKKAADEETAAD